MREAGRMMGEATALWRVLAAANSDDRPRLLQPGRLIEIPPL